MAATLAPEGLVPANRRTAVTLPAVVFALYALGAHASWEWFGAGSIGLAFFPAAGVTLTGLLIVPVRRWPAILVAAGVAELLVDLHHGLSPGWAVGFVVANLLEALVSALLLHRVAGWRPRRPGDLARVDDMQRFLLFGVVAGPLVGALVGATVRTAEGDHDWWFNYATWVAGDGLGVVVVGGLLLVLVASESSRSARWRARMVPLALVSFVVAELGFRVWEHSALLVVLPMLMWVAFRHEVPGVVVSGAVMCFVANHAGAIGDGPFVDLVDRSPAVRLGLTQVFLVGAVLSAWFGAIEVRDRAAAVSARDLAEQRRRRAEVMGRSGQLATDLGSVTDPRRLPGLIVRRVSAALGSRWCVLVLDTDAPEPTVLSWGPTPQSVRSVASAIGIDPVDADGARVGDRRCLLRSLGRGSGLMILERASGDALTDDQAELVDRVAAVVSHALDRLRAAAFEHAVADRLQRALLGPADELDGLRIGSVYRPAEDRLHAGGDWHDVVALDSRRAVVAIGDVVGHSVDAAATMGQVRSAFRALTTSWSDPAELLARLDDFVAKVPAARLTTMVVAHIDLDSRALTYSVAGHPPPVLVRGDGSAEFLEAGRGAPLGTTPGRTRTSAVVALDALDEIVLYTDGLVERRGEEIDVGLERLRRASAALAVADEGPDHWCTRLVGTLLGDIPQADDIAVLTVRLEPVLEPPPRGDTDEQRPGAASSLPDRPTP